MLILGVSLAFTNVLIDAQIPTRFFQQIGYFTPPVGMNLFISSYSFEKPVVEIYKATLPFMAVLLLALAFITYWPMLSLVLTGVH